MRNSRGPAEVAIADRIGQMLAAACRAPPRSPRGSSPSRRARGSFGSFLSIRWLTVCAPMVTSGSAASSHDLLPVHAQLVAERGDVDAVARAQIAHDAAQLVFGLHAAQPAVDRVEQLALLLDRARIRNSWSLPSMSRPMRLVLGDHRFEREPPQFAEPVGKAGRDVERERHLVFLQQRIGPLQQIAIAVVEGEADEAALEIAARSTAGASRRARSRRCASGAAAAAGARGTPA